MFPYDSIRDFAATLEKDGKLLKIPEMDQDQYEMTAFSYKLESRMKANAPAFIVEKTKMADRMYETPVIANLISSYGAVAKAFGADPKLINDNHCEMHDLAVEQILKNLNDDFKWKSIDPVIVDKKDAPCKEVILEGDEVDLLKFPWIKNNPADGGRFISAGSAVMDDPELGRNVGTYRMQIKGPKKAGLCFTAVSHAYKYMMNAAERGEESVSVSVAIGLDPVSWMMSSTRLAGEDEDEFALAGGFRGKPVALVKSETNDLLVPATAEFILEGEIPMETEEEGPYGELFGYVGKKSHTFYMNIKKITHRKNPWVYNLWPGIGGAFLTLPWDVSHFASLKKIMPNLVKLYTPTETPAIVIASIDKKLPGEGMEAGLLVLGNRSTGFSKRVVIIVDKDIDPVDTSRVIHAVGTRWQPYPASEIIKQSVHMPVDPSCRDMFLSSKIVIDATRQFESEGGPEIFPDDNLSVLEERAPDAFKLVESKWEDYFKSS
jgi:4-hydroxy-3-polyprenylbenzoate decarboxylase